MEIEDGCLRNDGGKNDDRSDPEVKRNQCQLFRQLKSWQTAFG